MTKYNKFLELLQDLQRCEPRIVSLQEAASQLELQSDSAVCVSVKQKLSSLSQSLTCLIRVCSVYLANIATTLNITPPQLLSLHTSDSSLQSLDQLPQLTQTVSV